MEDIIHAGVGGYIGNPFNGETWGVDGVFHFTRDQASRAVVSTLRSRVPPHMLLFLLIRPK